MQLLPCTGAGGDAFRAQAHRTPQHSGWHPISGVLTASAAVHVQMLVSAVVAVGRVLLVLLLVVSADVWA